MHLHKNAKNKALSSRNWKRAECKGPNGKDALTLQSSRNGNGKSRGRLSTARRPRRAETSQTEQAKFKEQTLREELRMNRKTMLTLMRWGVTVLAGIASSLYFIRRDVANHLSNIGKLPSYGIVPPGRWFVGTAFLIMIASLFCFMTSYLIKRQVSYRAQLLELDPSYSGIHEPPGNSKLRWFHLYLFFSFPLFDIMVWCYYRFGGNITIPW